MWFAIMGPLLVHDGTAAVDVPRGRQRVLLAALLLHAGNPVPADTLAELVWDGPPPASAPVTLRSHVLRLRRVLGPRAAARLVTRHPGYLLRAADDEFDMLRFRRLCREGGAAGRHGQWGRSHALLGEALGLWRGGLLSDIPSESLRSYHAQDLHALRLQAEEWLINAALHLGRHAEIVPRLQSLTARNPLREVFHGQLMLALYRCGRPAESLAAYHFARDALVRELGVEPGPGLQSLHQRILAGDPGLAGAGPVQLAGLEHEGYGRFTPRELPPAVTGFTGRAGELAALARFLGEAEGAPGTPVISAITGTAGAGKTSLALQWAHQIADRFPGGQLHLNLRGFDRSGVPVTPAEAIQGFLSALGVPPERIPASANAQAALYRSLLADRKMLVVLDNARDEDQVWPLLPAGSASLVVVTSRNQLTGLSARGARLLSLDVLTRAEAVQLLTARLGSRRAAADPGSVDEIAALCAHLPLALAVAAARAAARPSLPLSGLAAELRADGGRLDALDAGGPAVSVRDVFSWSYQQLTRPAARMFRLLGLHPGPDISVPAAASLAGLDQAAAARLLLELARGWLIAEPVPGRYAFHGLLRAYAAGQARECDPAAARRETITRILDHYLHTAARAAALLGPAAGPLALPPPGLGTCPERPVRREQALAWFDAEHQVLRRAVALAAETGADRHAWQLPVAADRYYQRRGAPRERAAMMDIALAAASRLGDEPGQAKCLRSLGTACIHTGEHFQARAHLERCLLLNQRLGDRLGEAAAQAGLMLLAEVQGRYDEALGHSTQALHHFQSAGCASGVAESLGSAGRLHALLGDYGQARALCEQALAIIAGLDNCDFAHSAWDTLGCIELGLGDPARAAARFELALTLCRADGDRCAEAGILVHAGDARRAAGDLSRAREAWRQALGVYAGLHHPGAGRVRDRLAAAEG